MGVTQAAGLSLRWFRDQFGAGVDDGRDPYERLSEEAARVKPGSEGAFWAAYLMGERTPHLDPSARARFCWTHRFAHSRASGSRDSRGCRLQPQDTFTIFSEIKVPVERIRLGGGGARSPLWRQIPSRHLRPRIEIVAAEEGAAYGAAILAGVGAKAWATVDQALRRSRPRSATRRPKSHR